MKWIQTDGGALIFLAWDALPLWYGGYAPDGGDDIEEDDTDFWRVAIEKQGETVVDTRGGSGLIIPFGMEPTCFIPSHRVFISVMANDVSTYSLERYLRLLPRVDWEDSKPWRCDGPGVLFDAACHGSMIELEECISVGLSPGDYTVRHGFVQGSLEELHVTQVVPRGAS